ncbi:hypothetical protein [Actinophytocola sp.]|uniref:hypothetical protein n=1 Tax=Actinophytocola sp. TaxID=1872138 RepID=UPI002D7EFCE4|nr:hypothetical protein [Actinophytocola sp.]HET9144142.1 hypothetical protein [Actinophytocola sp.]
MSSYPFVTIEPGDISVLRHERLHALEVSLVRVLLQMEEGPGDPSLGQQHDDLVARLAVHRASLGLPDAEPEGESDGKPAGEPAQGDSPAELRAAG